MLFLWLSIYLDLVGGCCASLHCSNLQEKWCSFGNLNETVARNGNSVPLSSNHFCCDEQPEFCAS